MMSDTNGAGAKDKATDYDGELIAPPPDLIDLGRDAPTLADAYSLADLEADQQRELVKVGKLPPWPVPNGEPPPYFGHGIGAHLSEMLGHGLSPGEMIAVGAASAGAGKTGWLMQLADGLALRNERVLAGEETWGRVLTPVLMASEMGIDALTWRALGRWTGHSAAMFRAGRTLLEHGHRDENKAREAWEAARQALAPDSEFMRGRRWSRVIPRSIFGRLVTDGPEAFVAKLQGIVEAFRDQLAGEHQNREIVPVIVLDPLQRFIGVDDEIAGMNALAKHLAAATLNGRWVTIETSDTNKSSAKGERTSGATDIEEGAGVFRGSYNLMHEVTAALYLRKPPLWQASEEEQRSHEYQAEIVVVKQRFGYAAPPWPRYRWRGPTLRFYPMTKDAAEAERRAEKAKKTPSKTNGEGRDDDRPC